MTLRTGDQPLDRLFIEDRIVVDAQDVIRFAAEGGDDAEVGAGGVPKLAGALDDLNVRKILFDRIAGAVGAAVVDDEDRNVKARAVDARQASQALKG